MTSQPAHEPDIDVEEEEDLEPLDDIRATIDAQLDDVVADAVLADLLTTVRRERIMTVASAEARDRSAAQDREERRLRANRRRPNEQLGHGWLRRGDDAIVRDPTPAPANVHAVSLADEISRTLHRIEIDLTDYDAVRGVPQLRGLGYVVHTIHEIRQLMNTSPWSPGATTEEQMRPALDRTRDALAELDDTAQRFFEGQEQRTHLRQFVCPHCGERSLIVYWARGITRCDRVPGQHHYKPCVCPNSLCECKNRPVAHRHTWFRFHPKSFSSSWDGLQRLLAKQGSSAAHYPDDPPRRRGRPTPTPTKDPRR